MLVKVLNPTLNGGLHVEKRLLHVVLAFLNTEIKLVHQVSPVVDVDLQLSQHLCVLVAQQDGEVVGQLGPALLIHMQAPGRVQGMLLSYLK